MLALETGVVDTCARGDERVMAATVSVVAGLMLALETRAVDTCARGNESMMAAMVPVIVGVAKCLRWQQERWPLVLVACWRRMFAPATRVVGATRAVDSHDGGAERGGRLCWWRRERWTVMLAMRASTMIAVDARAGDVVNFLGEAWAGC